MNDHLSEEQLTEWMLGVHDEAASQHIEICSACRADVNRVESAVSRFRESIHAAARKDDAYWMRQMAGIRTSLAKNRPSLRWALVLGIAVILFVVTMVTRTPRPSRQPGADDADEALLLEIRADVNRQYPSALAPAALLAQERNQILARNNVQQPHDSSAERRPQK